MSPFSSPPSLKESIETFFKSLYALAELQSMGKNSAISDPKACTAFVSLMTEIGSLIKDWNTVAEDLLERNNHTVQLWTDKNSGEKVLVCLREICPGNYLPAFFVPVSVCQDITGILDDVVQRISSEETQEAHLSPTP